MLKDQKVKKKKNSFAIEFFDSGTKMLSYFLEGDLKMSAGIGGVNVVNIETAIVNMYMRIDVHACMHALDAFLRLASVMLC